MLRRTNAAASVVSWLAPGCYRRGTLPFLGSSRLLPPSQSYTTGSASYASPLANQVAGKWTTVSDGYFDPRSLVKRSKGSSTLHLRDPRSMQRFEDHFAHLSETEYPPLLSFDADNNNRPLRCQLPVQDKGQLMAWLRLQGAADYDLPALAAALQTDSWTRCEEAMESSSWSSFWPPYILVHALGHLESFSDARSALERTADQLDALDVPTLAWTIHSLIDGLFNRLSAVHLVEPMTEVVLASCNAILHSAMKHGRDGWHQEVSDILELYVARLVRWPERRTRSAAMRVLDWICHQIHLGTLPRASLLRARDALCGITFGNDKALTPLPTSVVGFDTSPPTYYKWNFVTMDMCQHLLSLMAHDDGPQTMGVLAYFISIAGQHKQDDMSRKFFQLAQQQRSEETRHLWHYVTVQYLRFILTTGGQESLSEAQELFDLYLCRDPTGPSLAHWRGFFRCAVQHPQMDSFYFVRLLLRNSVRQQDDRAAKPLKLRGGPDVKYLSDPRIYKSLLRGLSHRTRSVSDDEVRAGIELWRGMLSNGVRPDADTTASMCRLLLIAGKWHEALVLLKPADAPEEVKNGARWLRGELGQAGVNLDSNESEYFCAAKYWQSPAEPSSEQTNTYAMNSMMSAAALNTENPLALYPLWKQLPRIFSCDPDGTSLEFLLMGALRFSDYATDREQNLIEWDLLSPLVQARRTFRNILMAEHPELKDAKEALAALVEDSQNWLLQGELRLQKYEDRVRSCLSAIFADRPDHQQASSSPSSASRRHTKAGVPVKGPLSSVVFNDHLFFLYVCVLTHIRFVYPNMTPATTLLQEPLEVLSWMRHLSIQPSTATLTLVVSLLADALPPGFYHGGQELRAAGGKRPMGPLHEWCLEWIDEGTLPTSAEVADQKKASLLRLIRQSRRY